MKDDIRNSYFNWLVDLMCRDRYEGEVTYRKLLMTLHNIEFRYSIMNDENRAKDGIDLRYRYTYINNLELSDDEECYFLEQPCSVLEMLIALALRCEETIMDDPQKGNRSKHWFWSMINNLGLGGMIDYDFDKKYTLHVITRFLDRKYAPNGKGGLFTIKDCERDLREVEIWYQLCWYLDTIIY